MNIPLGSFYSALPGLAILVVAESIEMFGERRFWKDKNEMFTNIAIGTVAIAISTSSKGFVYLFLTWLFKFRLFTIAPTAWWAWAICFFADDLSYYWFHRASHQVRFLWASHAVHHSPQNFTFSSALRMPWTSTLTGNFLFWFWMPLAGLAPMMIVTVKSFNAVYQFWLHTEKINKMPKWFEALFNTPSHHRVHHGSNVEYLDKNHGGTLIIWDRLFGTYCNETQKPVYGLTKNIKTKNLLGIVFHEWGGLYKDIRCASSAKERMQMIFLAPGWRKPASEK